MLAKSFKYASFVLFLSAELFNSSIDFHGNTADLVGLGLGWGIAFLGIEPLGFEVLFEFDSIEENAFKASVITDLRTRL